MNFCVGLGILVIFATGLGQADIHELVAEKMPTLNGEHARPLRETYHYAKPHVKNNGLNGNYKDNKVQYKYEYSQPEAIDDPLPEKVNYIHPVVVDFQQAQEQLKPLFTPAFVPGSLIPKDEVEPPVDTYRTKKPTTKYTTSTTTTRKPYSSTYTSSKNHYETTAKTTRSSAKAPHGHQGPSAPPKVENVYKPETAYPAKLHSNYSFDDDIIFINHHHGPNTSFNLFNVYDEVPLVSTPPEVIFQPGDDTAFADDLRVFDDYVHTFPPPKENLEQQAKSNPYHHQETTPKSPPPTPNDAKRNLEQRTTAKPYHHQHHQQTTTTKNPRQSGKNFANTAGDLKSGVTSSSNNGYYYEKPAIPFDS